MTLFKWSRTAASNASADASINWAEGQPPSSVNDSARAMMAATAKYRDDIAGAIVTGGTSTAYTIASYGTFDTLAHLDGQLIAFTPHIGNGATVTLNVDGLGGKPLRSAPSVELPTGALVQGTPYIALYNNSDGAFYLRGGSPYPYLIPLGAMLPYTGGSAPNSAFALPFGQAISRSTYAAYFSLVGTAYGSGDGSTTFNVPDLRGRVWAGLDNMGTGGNVARLQSAFAATFIGAAGGAATQTISQGNLPNVNFNVNDPGHAHVTVSAGIQIVVGEGTNLFAPGSTPSVPTNLVDLRGFNTASTTTGISVNSGGSGIAINTTQPTIVGNFILRII